MLESFVIGTGDEPVGFARRLARENAWTSSHAERVIREYLRFVFLCAESGHPCTPSDAVDQAWHLHLVYTWSYWNELCPLLPHPLHHGPTKGGREKDAKHRDWYVQTLISYRSLFKEEPPADIWPAAFEPEEEMIRVSRDRFWLLPRLRPEISALLLVSLALGGCALHSGAALPLILLLLIVLIVARASSNSRRSSRPKSPLDGGEATFLDGGLGSDIGSHNAEGHHDGGSHAGHGGDSHGGGHGCGSHGCGGHGCGSH